VNDYGIIPDVIPCTINAAKNNVIRLVPTVNTKYQIKLDLNGLNLSQDPDAL
jgi:hypothetical protein